MRDLLNLLLIAILAFPTSFLALPAQARAAASGGPATSWLPAAPNSASPPEAEALSADLRDLLASLADPSSSTGLYRARVRVPQPSDWPRLTKVGAAVLSKGPAEGGGEWAVVLTDAEQLEGLARLRFEPTAVEEMGALVAANATSTPWLASSLRPMLARAAQVEQQRRIGAAAVGSAAAEVRQMAGALAVEQQAGIASLSSVDGDGDGLTNTEELWWCTGVLNADSDGDGVSDGREVADLRDWMANRRSDPPASGKPFAGWPPDRPGCYDDDRDSVPDLAERWELGLNAMWESTDRDQFDDGQELFGATNCPGSGSACGYGSLPPASNEPGIVLFPEMPSWVRPPGKHPMVAAFPEVQVRLMPDAGGRLFRMEAATEIRTDHTILSGEAHSYGSATTTGTSTTTAETNTWNDWTEVSEYHYENAGTQSSPSQGNRPSLGTTILAACRRERSSQPFRWW